MYTHPDKIIKACEDAYQLPYGTLLQWGRSRTVAEARNVAMYLCRCCTPLSLCEIAKAFKRDHSSIVHAVRRVKTLVAKKATIHKLADELIKKFERGDNHESTRDWGINCC